MKNDFIHSDSRRLATQVFSSISLNWWWDSREMNELMMGFGMKDSHLMAYSFLSCYFASSALNHVIFLNVESAGSGAAEGCRQSRGSPSGGFVGQTDRPTAACCCNKELKPAVSCEQARRKKGREIPGRKNRQTDIPVVPRVSTGIFH